MKPPSFVTITRFTFDSHNFENNGCSRRKCPKYAPDKICDNCIRLTNYTDDGDYRNFTNILIKEIT